MISRLDRGRELSVSAQTLDRSLLKSIELNQVSVSYGEATPFTAQNLTVKEPLQTILLSFFQGNRTFGIEAENSIIDASIPQFALNPAGTSSGSWLLKSWLERNSLDFTVNSLTAGIQLPQLSAEIKGGKLSLLLGPKLSLSSFGATMDLGTLTMGGDTFQANQLALSLNKQLQLQLTAQSATSDFFDSDVSFSKLVVQSRLPSFNLGKETFVIEVSLGSLSMDRAQGLFTIPSLSGKITLENMKLSLAETSFDSLRVEHENYLIEMPTSSVTGKFLDTSLLLGFVTKDEDQTTLVVKGEKAVVFKSLQGSAELQDGGNQYAKVSLKALEANMYGWDIALEGISISAQAKVKDSDYESLDITMDTISSLYWEKQNIQVDSPLALSLHFSEYFAKLSTSFAMEDLTSNLAQGSFALSAGYQNYFGQQQIEATISYGEQLSLYGLYDLPEAGRGTLSIDSRLQNLNIAEFQPTIDTYATFLNPYVSKETLLTGNLSFLSRQGEGKLFSFDGTISIDLALEGLSVGNRTLNAGSTLFSHIKSDMVDIDSLTLTTSGYRMLFTGQTAIGTWLPSGDLSLSNAENGSTLFSIAFSPLPPKKYSFSITTPFVQSLGIVGSIEQGSVGTILSQAELSLGTTSYPLEIAFSPSTLDFNLTSREQLSISASFVPPVSVRILTDSLPLPANSFLKGALLSGSLSFTINDLHDWKILSDKILLESVSLLGNPYTLSGALDATPTRIKADSLTVSDGNQIFTGAFLYQGTDLIENATAKLSNPFSLSFVLDDTNLQKIEVALSSEGKRVEGIITIDAFDLTLISPYLQGVLLDASFVGFTDFKKLLDVDGNLELTSSENWAVPLSVRTDIIARDNLLTFDKAAISYGESSIEDFELSLNTGNGMLISKGRLQSVKHLLYTDQDSHVSFYLALGFAPVDSIFNLPLAIRNNLQEKLVASLSLTDILLLGEKGFADGDYTVTYQDKKIAVDSKLLTFAYDLNSYTVSASVDKRFGVGLELEGTLENDYMYLEANSINFPLPLLNRIFAQPILSFEEGNVEGQLLIAGAPSSLKTYGQLFVDSAKLKVFWLPNDIVSAKNITATFNGERGTTPFFPLFSTNVLTGKTVKGNGKISAYLSGLTISNYQINATLDDGSVQVWLPILDLDAEVKAYAKGNFELTGIGLETWIAGDVLIDDATMSTGLKNLPVWYVSKNRTSLNINLTTGRNISLYYPNPINPIIKATFNENQKMSLIYDHKNSLFNIDGVFNFRSGEIYYFQKNFFITEGSLSIHTDALAGQGTIQPKINLRAKMADFDSSGNRVDIYLVLRDSTLTNLSPTFESIPSKDINDILEILGQSILPTGVYGQVNLSSVASLAVAATDVAERLGLISNTTNNTDLTDVIRISLGLDMFSLRSNIVQNILLEAIPGSNYSYTYSPLARYLNNTTMFMGKYVGKNFFLQALLHLTAMDSSEVTRSFLVPDLSLDLELSLEWDNPLSTFSLFTQPTELSVLNILDTIGFSVTRRIVLR
jgi:hypothetical protein